MLQEEQKQSPTRVCVRIPLYVTATIDADGAVTLDDVCKEDNTIRMAAEEALEHLQTELIPGRFMYWTELAGKGSAWEPLDHMADADNYAPEVLDGMIALDAAIAISDTYGQQALNQKFLLGRNTAEGVIVVGLYRINADGVSRVVTP